MFIYTRYSKIESYLKVVKSSLPSLLNRGTRAINLPKKDSITREMCAISYR